MFNIIIHYLGFEENIKVHGYILTNILYIVLLYLLY